MKDEDEETKISPTLIGIFLFLVVGSSIVQVLRLFQVSDSVAGKAEDA